MKQNQYIVTLEIGSSKIVGVLAEKLPTGQVTVTNVFEEQTSNCVRYGVVQNIENVKSSINRIVKSIETAVDGTVSRVYVGLSGRSIHNVPVEITRTLDSNTSISQNTINGILADARRNSVKGYDVIDAVPCSFVVDGSETRTPVGQLGGKIKATINLIVAKPRLKLNMEHALSLGGNSKHFIITPIAMGEFLLTKDELELGGLLLDLGAETTTIAYYRHSTLQFLSTLPMGGRNLTRDIANGLGVVEDSAESIKKAIPNPLDDGQGESVLIDGVKSSDAANYVVSRLDEILFNVSETLNNAGYGGDAVKTIVLAGGTSHLHGIDRRLNQYFSAKVRAVSMPAGITVRTHTFNRLEYAESFALVLEAAKLLGNSDTCLERNVFEAPEIEIVKPVEPVKPVQDTDEDDLPVKQKKSWAESIADKFRRFFTEDDSAVMD